MKNICISLVALFIVSTSAITVQAQKGCGTDNQQLVELAASLKSIQKSMQKSIPKDSTIIIPIVFHVLEWDWVPPSDEKLIEELASYNLDFQKLNADTSFVSPPFDAITAGIQVEFRLAQIDPDGNCTTGITRHRDKRTGGGWETDGTYKNDIQKKWNNPWDESKYFNVYLVMGGTYAHATLTGPASGVLGFSGAERGMMTHEFGHWLGLPHTFGSCTNDGDKIDDTPICTMTTGCDATTNTCDEGSGDLRDNITNFLSYNGCRKMFTQGQVDRMYATLASSNFNRNNLGTPSNLNATGTADPYVYGNTPCAPVAEPYVASKVYCPGDEQTFGYTFFNVAKIDSVFWEFPGGTPATSTKDNPEVDYASAGTYDIILTVYSGGLSYTDTAFDIGGSAPTDGGIVYPFVETFEDETIFNSLWTVNNYNSDNIFWKTTGLGAYSGDRSLWIRSNSDTPNNEVDEIVSPTIDLSLSATLGTTELSFWLSTAQNGTKEDKLDILFTKDCGQTWNQFYSKKGAELSTTTATIIDDKYKPTSIDDWRLEKVTLPLGYCVPNVQFKFKFKGNQGSFLYIDDLNYETVGIDEQSIKRTVNIYPNPIDATSIIAFELQQPEEVEVEVYNVLGARISKTSYGKLSKGSHKLQLSEMLSEPNGIYIVKARFNKEVVVRKIVVE